MIALLGLMVVFMLWAIGHVGVRKGWYDDEVEAERWSVALREDRS